GIRGFHVTGVQTCALPILPKNSYKPGTRSVDLNEVLPDFVHTALRKALPLFGKKMRGYYTNEAILVGVESRTSSPVRIPRDKERSEERRVGIPLSGR